MLCGMRRVRDDDGGQAVAEDDWVVVAQHMQQLAWNPIDGASVDLLSLEDALTEQGIEASFLPYRPGESGGFTDALHQPLQLLVKRSDAVRAREIAVDILGAGCDMIT